MMRTTPLTPRFGVEITGIDLETLDAPGFSEIRAAFERHSVLLFRGQEISPEAHLRLAQMFGPLEDRHADEKAPGEAFKIPEVSNVRADGSVSGEMDIHTLNLKSNFLWHTDSTFLPVPALANIITARVVTSEGGETELASTRAAWADMPGEMREQLPDAIVWHRYAQSRARISPELAKLPLFTKWPDRAWRAVWPNPETGEEAVYLASHAFRIEGMDPDEGAALIDEAIAFCTQPAYTYLHRWEVGDLIIFDERATLHRGRPWPYEEPRTLASICVSAGPRDGLDAVRPEA
ncbi:MAG: TauD/TfdA family dioxygenase [Pseudomonadota bacterium]